jgi:hypothetical protein|tara:strand:+ start:227 stop:481 length:255 start_codon:yes stop_codon:yes gene_type:complete
MARIQQAKKKQLIVLQVNGDSFIKYQVRRGKGTQEAQNPRNLGIHNSPLSSIAYIQPYKKRKLAGTPNTKTERASLPFHQSKIK